MKVKVIDSRLCIVGAATKISSSSTRLIPLHTSREVTLKMDGDRYGFCKKESYHPPLT
jgi:hypothetical protein